MSSTVSVQKAIQWRRSLMTSEVCNGEVHIFHVRTVMHSSSVTRNCKHMGHDKKKSETGHLSESNEEGTA